MAKNDSPAAVLGPRMQQLFRRRQDASVHRFLSFHINNSQVIYATDKAIFTCSTATLFSEMADWRDLTPEEQQAAAATVVVSSYTPKLPELPSGMGEGLSKMFETLTAAIDRVKDDSKYVDQANALNSLVKTGVEVGKLQIEAYKTLVLR